MRSFALNSNRLAALALGCCAALPGHALVLTGTYNTPFTVDSAVTGAPVNIGSGVISSLSIVIDLFKCGGDPANVTSPANVGDSCNTTEPAFAREISLRLVGPGALGSVDLIAPDTYFVDPQLADGTPSGPEPGGRIVLTFADGNPTVNGAVFQSGVFGPLSPTFASAFAGQDAAGDWMLMAGDDAVDSPLGIMSYTLNVTVRDLPAGQAPEPTTILLLGLGLVGLSVVRRRRD